MIKNKEIRESVQHCLDVLEVKIQVLNNGRLALLDLLEALDEVPEEAPSVTLPAPPSRLSPIIPVQEQNGYCSRLPALEEGRKKFPRGFWTSRDVLVHIKELPGVFTNKDVAKRFDLGTRRSARVIALWMNMGWCDWERSGHYRKTGTALEQHVDKPIEVPA